MSAIQTSVWEFTLSGKATFFMRRFCFLFSLFLSGLAAPLYSQEPAGFPIRIERVMVVGNEKTREEVILREIPFRFPDTLSMEDLNSIQNRITNLFLFNRVELAIIGEPEHAILLIQVTEFWYIYPLPLLFINERDWDKISYGFQLSHRNFRGMNEQLTVGGWFGYNPAFFLRYYNPWVGRQSRFMVGLNFFGRKVGNKFYDFDERHLGGTISFGKRLSLHRYLQASVEVKRIQLPEEFKEYSFSGSGTDLVPKIILEYRHDRRDLFEYPRKGFLVSWNVARAGFNQHQPSFWRFSFDHRAYIKPFQRVSLGARNFLMLNYGELPIYDRVFIGYGERIRGYFDRVFTAQNLMTYNFETRISILPVRYLSWNEAPLFGMFFQQLKYGLSMGIFMDSGVVWDRREELALNNHFTGYGVGLHFHLPYIHVLRLDHAWNDRGQGEWIIEVGVVF